MVALGPQFRFDNDPTFEGENSYVRKKEDGDQTKMTVMHTPEGRFDYDVRTRPGAFDIEVKHNNTVIGAMYGPNPGESSDEKPGKVPIGSISVHSKYARRGLATQMLRLARQHMPEGNEIVHSSALTTGGERWVEGLKRKGIE